MYLNDKRIAVDHINKKWVKVLTVITYVISISLIALVLGLYYRLVWHPKYEVDTKPYEIKPIMLGTINVLKADEQKENVRLLDVVQVIAVHVLID
jgi:hypothetical protein